MTSQPPRSLDKAPGPGDMEDSIWRELLDSKTQNASREPSKIFQNLSLSSLAEDQNPTSDIEYCDTDSQWSENGSLMSTCFSSTSTSGTRSTKISLSSRESCPDEDDPGEDQITFPSYDDVGYYGQDEGLEHPAPYAFSENQTPPPAFEDIPDPTWRPDDDAALRTMPTRHVDYLSHHWREQDLWTSWRHITSKRKAYSNSARLENASWRVWGKLRLNMGTVSPERLNWLKDCDVTWLYGPLQPGPVDLLGTNSILHSQTIVHTSPHPSAKNFLNKKPILKKRTMSEIMLSQSLSSSSLLRQAAAAVQAQQSKRRQPTKSEQTDLAFAPRLRGLKNTTVLSSISSSGLASPGTGEKKYIHFNEQVEQCIALEMKGDGDDGEDDNDVFATYDDGNYDDDTDSDGGIVMKRSNSMRKLPTLHKNTKACRGFSAESKTIAMLPSTTLKYRADTLGPPETAMKHSNGFWNGSKLSPSASPETLCPSKPSTRILLGGDEEDDDDVNWQSPGAFANQQDGVLVTQERFKGLHTSGSSSSLTEEPSGMRRTPSGMFMSYEEDEDDVVSEGLFGKVINTVNTARDIYYLVFNGDRIIQRNPSLNPHTEASKNGMSPPVSSSKSPVRLRYLLPLVDHSLFSESNEISPVVSKASTSSPTSILDNMVGPVKTGLTFNLESADLLSPIQTDPIAKSEAFDVPEKSANVLEQGSEDAEIDSTLTRDELETLAERPDIREINKSIHSVSLFSEFPIRICSRESFNTIEGGVDGYQTTSDSCSGESDETASSSGIYQELCDVTEAGTDSIQEVVRSALDPMRQALVDRVIEEFWAIFNQSWDTGFRECARESSSSSPGLPNGAINPVSESSSPPGRRKRRRGDDDRPDDKNNRDSRNPEGSAGPSNGPEDSTRFACPFRKHNSRLYSVYSHPVCSLSHWETIARVKEHLYRGHRMAVHCKRCWKIFKNQEQLDSHLTVATSDICDLQPGHPPEGITSEHERRLRSRKKTSPDQNEAERWKDIYKLLFPNEEIPSPCELAQFYIIILSRSMKKIADNCTDFEPLQEDTPMSPDSRELANYEDYIRRELPRLVRSNIEEAVRREMQPFEASLISNLVEIIQDCQDRVFKSYRETQGISDEIQMPPSIDCEASNSSTILDGGEGPSSRPIGRSSHPQSTFLDTIFEPPAPQSTHSISPSFTTNNSGGPLPRLASDMIPSDSGYSSEQLQLCGCSGPCNCSTLHGQDVKDNASQDIRNDNLQWNEWGFYPPWNQLDSIGSGFNWPGGD